MFTRLPLASFLALLTIQGYAARLPVQRRGGSATPSLTYHPNTDLNCRWWWDADHGLPCETVLEWSGLTMDDFKKWNPSINTCADWQEGNSYCIDVPRLPAWTRNCTATKPTTTATPTPTMTPTTTATPTTMVPSTTTGGNGIATPSPTQPGMVNNCNRFYLVSSGDTCSTVASRAGISLSQFSAWNPQTGGASCSSLWLDYYVCIGTMGTSNPQPSTTNGGNTTSSTSSPQPSTTNGGSTTSSTSSPQLSTSNGGSTTSSTSGPQPSTTNEGNSIETPAPIQSGMTPNCREFYLVQPGDTCNAIASSHGISTSDFIEWNPAAGSDCRTLWANTYACVAV
ncbi:hypothetical protein DL764_009280 [Monosporascus ibericus]|uniref:LysM domain-containing protein n=1 Tax=Monosporascus ibericus TaxID=155417 RepID=A0A4Q4SVC4_9PEZI|nr:hypothetical protein DL764_009280 [Monosporascus ibericus]